MNDPNQNTTRPFLQQAAEHYFSSGESDGAVFIFPNRRSISFFKKYLTGAVASPDLNPSGQPVLLPRMMTMNEFLVSLQGGMVADRVTLLLELYECYKELNTKAEPLDEFIFWGDVILNDFGDIDKYLSDAHSVLTNVADFRALQDNSHLSDEQKTAIEQFVGHFREGSSMKPGLNPEDDNVKARFLSIWNLLAPLYDNFRRRLADKGLAYEGMIYRSVAERLSSESVADLLSKAFGGAKRYIFIGLNVLNECEKRVMSKMRDAGLALFCWDWQSEMIQDPQNRSSVFMKENVVQFPMNWSLDGVDKVPEVTVISVPSSVGQAKQVPSILRQIGEEVGMDTAIVLPDERLLMPLLNSIPPEVKDINVTMGFPMTDSVLFSLMGEATAAQLHLRQKEGEWYFYHKQVWEIFSMSLLLDSLDAAGKGIINHIKKEHKFFIPLSDFKGNVLLETLFTPVVTDPKAADPDQIRRIQDWQLSLILALVPGIRKNKDFSFELDFARRYHCAVTLLRSKDLPIMPASYFRLLDRLLGSEALPFSGEPLKGLQIMGPLETRALDFKNLVILSCNEGVFPRRSVSSSFIPAEIRKGFGLPTYEHQDAVWAYYFYRSIQRAERVWLIYDSRTGEGQSGEESRYIKQLQYHFRLPLKRQVAGGGTSIASQTMEISKTEEDITFIKNNPLSASAVEQYLICPARFYYSFVKRLRPEDEVEESLDSGMIGNVFHRTMQGLYTRPDEKVTKQYIESLLGNKNTLKQCVRENILQELSSTEVSGRNLVIERVIVEYVVKTLERDLELLKREGGCFIIHGLERHCKWVFDETFTFHGYIDRLDEVGGRIRVVDYKTGKLKTMETGIPAGKTEEAVEKLFAPPDAKGNKNRPEKIFQLFLYDMFVEQLKKSGEIPGNKQIVNSIYHPGEFFKKTVKENVLDPVFSALVKDRLRAKLDEMTDLSIPFRLTDDKDGVCKKCDFRSICGR